MKPTHNPGRKLLANCTDEEIQLYAAGKGYDLSQEDCDLIRAPAWVCLGRETLAHALEDFLSAYEH